MKNRCFIAPARREGARCLRLALAAVFCLLALPSAAAAQAVLPGDEPNGPYPGWWSWPAMVRQIEQWEQQYPEIFHKQVFGTTYEGRDMLVVKISKDARTDDPSKPEVLFMAGIHAREQQPQVAVMRFMEDLVTGYGSDERITRLVDTRSIWVIPVYNIDGKVHDFKIGNGTNRGGMWRTTRRPTPPVSGGRRGGGPRPTYGIDLNRNNPVGWGSASDTPGTQTYHGTGPLSEPESRSLYNLLSARNFRVFLDIHSSANSYLYPGHLIREEFERYVHLTNGMKERQVRPFRGGPTRSESQAGNTSGTGVGQTHVMGLYIFGAYSYVFELAGLGGGFYPTGEAMREHYENEVKEPLLFLVEEAANLPLKQPGSVRLTNATLSGPVTPGSRVEWRPELEGETAYGVLVTRDGHLRVRGDYRLLPLTGNGFFLQVSEDATPGMQLPLTFYVWDRQRRQTVIDVRIQVVAPGGQ